MTISEKSAYLKGLMDGLNLNTETNEGKMIAAIVDLLGDVTRRLADVEETTIAISDELDEIEEDLDAIEDYILDEEDEDEDDDWDEDWDEDDFDDEEEPDEGFDYGDEDSTIYEVECPTCGEKICFTEEFDLDNFLCPACGNKIDDIELIDGCGDCEGCPEDCESRGMCDGCHNV